MRKQRRGMDGPTTCPYEAQCDLSNPRRSSCKSPAAHCIAHVIPKRCTFGIVGIGIFLRLRDPEYEFRTSSRTKFITLLRYRRRVEVAIHSTRLPSMLPRLSLLLQNSAATVTFVPSSAHSYGLRLTDPIGKIRVPSKRRGADADSPTCTSPTRLLTLPYYDSPSSKSIPRHLVIYNTR